MMMRDLKAFPEVCFLLGLPRSGTTLLAHLLQQHPDILAPPEPWLLLALEAMGTVDHRHPAGSSLIRAATSEFFGRIDQSSVHRVFADAAYGQYLAAATKRIFIDKTPRYWMVLGFLEALYPEAPRILLIRNPYAIAASLKSTWGIPLHSASCPSAIGACLADLVRGQPTPAIASSLADLVLGLPALAEQRGHPQTQVVHYERLAAGPDEEIRRLIASLGCDPAAIESGTTEKTDYLQSSSFGDRNILERTAVDSRSIQAWQTALSVEEMQAVTDLVGSELLLDLGYEEELQYARKAGVVDRGRAVTERYRRLFRTGWNMLGGTRATSFDISAQSVAGAAPKQAEENASSASDPSGMDGPEPTGKSEVEENLTLVNSMVCDLEQALTASNVDQRS
ncbi:sulfotransferase [Bradyrhizobium sp. Cp5.3]|uniref:nodulation protein NoeE n=1 Tax=Bradyrhizobium sp. Cp5.3 TaxID=443598 RepID=UPI000686A2E6|nr:sulfotransferase [Bradyrhizobium sp. Cp5.3]